MAEGKRKRDGVLRALKVILDQVDYTVGNCRVNEMVGAVLPKAVIASAREEIAKAEAESGAVKGEPEYIDEEEAYRYE